MDEGLSFARNTHAFVIKVWLEGHAAESGAAIWRGHITHAYTNERRYMQSTDELVTFVNRFIREWDLNE